MPLLQAIVWTVLHQSQQLLVRFDAPLLLVQHQSIQRYFPLLLVLCARCSLRCHAVTFPPHVTSTSAIEKGKWLEWCDAPQRTDSSGSNGPVEPDLDLDEEESFIMGRLVSADVIEHETDHAPDYGEYGVISSRLALS
jgi:hypothetical protein